MDVSDRCCRNAVCPQRSKFGGSNIIKHSRFKLANGSNRRRYLCKACGKTFVSTRATPYYRLRCSKSDFDEVAAMSVEGMSISSIARVKGLSWNTVARWLERAAVAAWEFNDRLADHLELLKCHYNFIRPHRGLKFGTEVRTPAMQAGIATRMLTFREVFTVVAGPLFCVCRILDFEPARATMKSLCEAA